MLVIVIKIRKSGLKDFMPSSESPLFSLKKFPQRETKKIQENKKQKLCNCSRIKYTGYLKNLAGCYSLRPVKKITEAK